MAKKKDAVHRLIVGDELYLYGAVGEGWWGDFFTSKEVAEALDMFEGDLTCRVNSGGGVAFEGRAIHSLLKNYPGIVTIVVDSIAASAASAFLMAGDDIQMMPGSVMMIHDPRNASYGTAKDHDRNSKVLDKLATQFAKTYAERAGISVDEAREIMLAETWLDADEAVERGFADSVVSDFDDDEAATACLFNYAIYKNAPENLVAIAKAAAAHFQSPPAPAIQPKETSMPKQVIGTEPALPASDPATAASATTDQHMSVDDVRLVMSQADKAGLTFKEANDIIGKAQNRQAASDMIIDIVASKAVPAPNGTAATVTADATDKFVQGATMALSMKVGLTENAERNEFSGLSMLELARESLMLNNVAGARGMDKLAMVGQAFMLGGAHSTSDFTNILSNVARKSVLKGYQEAEETFDLWTSTGYVSDFKPTSRVDIGLFPSLQKVDEGSEYNYGKMGDRGVTVAIATYGRMIAFTRQAIINDDLSLLGSVPTKMGRASKRTIGNLVYAVLNTNPNFADGKAIFHADHGNLSGALAAPSELNLQAAYNAMGEQQDDDAHAASLNITPKYLLHNNYRFSLKTLLESEGATADNKSAKVVNTVQGLVVPIEDRRITKNTWFMAADQNMVDTIEVTYLDGQTAPYIETQNGWNIDGAEMKVRMDAGVNAIGVKGLYKGQ